jgi:hypothetical protein
MKRFFHITILFVLFFLILIFTKPEVFKYKFNNNLIKSYLCSQDIPYEPPCKRLFLSDSDIHIASGYLYINGNDPASYNFQHPPLIKYLFGLSINLFRNPYYVNLLFGLGLIFLTYFIALKIYKSEIVSFLSSLLLVVDPLFINISSSALLDIGQAFFLLLYFVSLFFIKNIWLLGISLGFLLASKFWGGSLFFLLLFWFFGFYKRKIETKKFLFHLLIAFITLCFIYSKSFIDKGEFFNIMYFQLKVFKYWLQHSTTTMFGANLVLFLIGSFKSWWGNKSFSRSDVWSIIWPISFFINMFASYFYSKKSAINLKFLVSIIPILYLFYLSAQAPFSRYFILILPFLYITTTGWIVNKYKFYN